MTEIQRFDSPLAFEVVALFVADHATIENNKVYVNGGFWDHLNIPDFPTQESFTLVAGIKWPSRAFLEDHRIVVEIVDADEERLPFRIDQNWRVGPAPHMQPGEPMIVSLAFQVNGLWLEHAGDYWFVLSIDGEEKGRYRVRAIHMPVFQPPQQAPNGDDAEEE